MQFYARAFGNTVCVAASDSASFTLVNIYLPSLPPPHTHTLSLSLTQSASYTCQVSGPGLKSATVNHPTHVLVELIQSCDSHVIVFLLTAGGTAEIQ